MEKYDQSYFGREEFNHPIFGEDVDCLLKPMLSFDSSSFDPSMFFDQPIIGNYQGQEEKLPEPREEKETSETTAQDNQATMQLINSHAELNVVESPKVTECPSLSIKVQSSDDFKSFSQSVSYHFLNPNVRILGKQKYSNGTPMKKGIVPILKKVRVIKRLIHSTPNLNVYSIESSPDDIVARPTSLQ